MAVAQSLSTDAAVCNTIGCRREAGMGGLVPSAAVRVQLPMACSMRAENPEVHGAGMQSRDVGWKSRVALLPHLCCYPKHEPRGHMRAQEPLWQKWQKHDGRGWMETPSPRTARTHAHVRAHTRSHASIPHAHLREHTGAYARMHEDKHARMHACTHACTHACRPVSDHAVSTPIQAAMPHSTRPGKCITAGCGRRT